jgi:very-short-patch-repair endonuclease
LADDKARIEQRVERLRQKLLDLSTMNRMLSFKHPKASCLRVVDELPHQLFDVLLNNETLTFEPVAEPTPRELDAYNAPRPDQVRRATEPKSTARPDAATWARHLGINVNYDLPVETDVSERPDHHSDKKIQTLHYPDELDARLRKIRAAGRTAIEESGANMLYLAFGFLEWRDQQTSKAHQAPLVLMPVELEREPIRGGQFRTRIRRISEELQPNLSLKKKLEELNIDLPVLGEDQSLEAYLREVTLAIKHKPEWTVRHYVTLGLFEFGKILLYLDLDPDRWPAHTPLSDNPLVKEILGGWDPGEGVSEEGESWGGTQDDSPRAAQFRDLNLEVVDRADSSQCEALEVALSGRNLVIQGPPGTGKSQTITNLVAAALARGKTVLFVAEKLAALEVVRRRMRELGLGDFCLELHSHKTRKTEALEDIATRIQAGARIRPPKDYEGALSRLAARRERLSAYIDIVSNPAAGFAGLTISDALMKAGQARRKLGPSVKAVEALRDYFTAPADLNWAKFADAKGRLRQFSAAIVDLGADDSAFGHVWAGVSSARVLPHDCDQVAGLAADWADKVDALLDLLGDPRLEHLTLEAIAAADEGLSAISVVRPDLLRADECVVGVEHHLGISLDRSPVTAGEMIAICGIAASAPMADLGLRNPALVSDGAVKELTEHQERLSTLRASADELAAAFRESASGTHNDDLEEWAAALSQKSLFARFGRRWRTAVQSANSILRPASQSLKPVQKASLLERLRVHHLVLKAVKDDREMAAMVGPSFSDLNFSCAAHLRVATWADQVRATLAPNLTAPLLYAATESIVGVAGLAEAATISSLEKVRDWEGAPVSKVSFWQMGVRATVKSATAVVAEAAAIDEDWESLRSAVRQCSSAAQTALEAEGRFKAATGLDEHYWFGEGGRPDLSGISAQARSAAAEPDLLPAWLDFDRAFRSSDSEFEAPLSVAGADGSVAPALMPLALDFLVFDAIARDAFAANPALLSASGKSLDVLRREYAAIDAEVMELRRAHIAASLLTKRPPEGRSGARKADLTEMILLRAELAKQKRHLPIRQLVARAGRAIQTLKPCFMMGPLSVAQYIQPGGLKFDLVIMDEASQRRPEDAIGALARGGQAVIVGDTKQLPPTSFFDRIADASADDEGEETTLAEDSKSILELAEAIFTPRMLRWHYRSRHESLIAFSNKQFYKNDLIVFPSPSGQGGRFGIGWNYQPEGAATSGVNPVEARAVAKAAALMLLNDRRRTVGVVAMNIRQAQRITDELAALANVDPVLAKVLSEAENNTRGEPFFVKNLENVQGDERDVIIISMTYGPATPGARVPQNFGPITMETGWRRLNVLFTRAKERMEIFSSMRASDILPKEGSDRGSRSLKLFLDYAETGQLGGEITLSDRDPDNDFEDAVIEGLQELNYQCVPQVGVANFFLDIGIRDPNAPQEFIAAIECDGASYHSSKSARDRDRLRQEILENLGWNILRIWSTDWFRDPAGEVARVSAELKKLVAAKAAQRTSRRDEPVVTALRPVQSDLPLAEPVEVRKAARQHDELSQDEAREKLIELREAVIKLAFPDADPARGLLRKSMLDELVRKRPKDSSEFLGKISIDLRQNTDAAQLKKFGESVFEILERTR